MSLKRMVTKLALAFAAKKGAEVFRNAGGLKGVQDMLAGRQSGTGSSVGHGRVGGTRASDTGGLGNILDSLGYAGATNGREAGVNGQISPLNAGLGTLFGALAGITGGSKAQASDEEALSEQVSEDNIQTDRDAKSMLRAMVHMARADGGVSDDEYDSLMDILHDASESDREAIHMAMREPINAEGIAKDTSPQARKEVYAAALLVGEPDNPAEQNFLSKLAAHLNLSHADVEKLHGAMQKAPA